LRQQRTHEIKDFGKDEEWTGWKKVDIKKGTKPKKELPGILENGRGGAQERAWKSRIEWGEVQNVEASGGRASQM